MTVVLTGGGGFLGWHVRVLLHALGEPDVRLISLGDSFDQKRAAEVISGTDRLIHLAGVNRGSDAEVGDGNVVLAEHVSRALADSDAPPPVVVFANSTQVGNATTYAIAKERAAGIVERTCERKNLQFINVFLPNLFGEHGRPFYNAVTATFCHLLARGEQPTIEHDIDLTLMHAQGDRKSVV